jgi:D-beta-D-heptose 7-phosphate kinase/D-beta-D-heptose 1-phosphate adenosyltransferase
MKAKKHTVLSREMLSLQLEEERRLGKKVVFTNGCFDLLHIGHLRYLAEARSLGDLLVVGLNSDASVQAIKGPNRPIIPEEDRAEVLAAMEMVDYVSLFDEPTPQQLIEAVQPDVLVKGGDWSIDTIVGREVVWARGGRVLNIPVVEGLSTSAIIRQVVEQPL